MIVRDNHIQLKTYPSWAGKASKGPKQLKALQIRFLSWVNLQKEKNKSQHAKTSREPL